jgi:hypothetical protein
MSRNLWLCLCLAVNAVAADTPKTVVIADFERGVDHFSNLARQDTTVAAVGAGSLRLSSDFYGGKQPGVSTGRYLRLHHRRLSELRFQVRSKNVTRLNLQLVDATGQTHQHPIVLTPDSQWHPVVIRNFAAAEHWGGAANGQFHWPARSLSLRIPRAAVVNGNRADIWFDQVEAVITE